jgi:hypothetical protein
MTGLPRDRWVGASPGGNVTPGGQALEAIAAVRMFCIGLRSNPLTEHIANRLEELIDDIMRAPS